MNDFVKTNDLVMRSYFKDLKATIPTYQRSYEWGSDQIEDFLVDLYSEVAESEQRKSPYFFGPIITTNDSNSDEKQIIDGQQRLTTVTIFLAVMRDLLDEMQGDENAAKLQNVITNHFIGDGSKYSEFRLTQVGTIENYFREHIQQHKKSSSVKEKKIMTGKGSRGKGKVNNLIRAYNQILKYLRKKLEIYEKDSEKIKHLETVLNVFANHFFIVEIWAPNRTEAFQIFQTINARGLDLSAADLIKADFFGNSGTYTEQVIDIWNSIQEVIGNLKYSDFIRYSWNSMNRFTTNRRLYKSVSEEIKTSETIYSFMKFLEKLAPAYAELNEESDISYLSDSYEAKRIRNIFQELNALQFKTYIPVYMAMVIRNYSEASILAIMKQVTSLLVRNKIMAKGTNWLEKFLAENARIINESEKSENEQVTEVTANIKDELPSDEMVKALLNSYEYAADNNLVRFILRAIENENLGEKGFIAIDNNRVHIEHIMPKNPDSFEVWNVTEELHEEYLWKIGNLTLWLGTKNSAAQNSEYAKKAVVYRDSDVIMTRKLVEIDHWNTEKIDERTDAIIDQFLAIY